MFTGRFLSRIQVSSCSKACKTRSHTKDWRKQMIQIAVSIICLFYIADSSYNYVKNYYILKENKCNTLFCQIKFVIFALVFYIFSFSLLSTFVRYQIHIPLYIELFILAVYTFLNIAVSLIAAIISRKKYKK